MNTGEGSVGTPPSAVAPSWTAPSDIERRLYEAKMRGDWPAFFDVLAGTDLFLAVSRRQADSAPDSVFFTPYWNPQTNTQCLAVFTEGMLPAPVPDPVFVARSLDWYGRAWEDADPPFLAVNPGSPCEAFLPTTPAHRAVWRQHHERARNARAADSACGQSHTHGKLRALHVGGPLHGPVAHGLACAALLFVKNGELWNSMGYHGSGYHHEKYRLEKWWGVTSRETWYRTQERLLNADMVSDVWQFVLSVRHALARDFAGSVAIEHWRESAERVLRRGIEEAGAARITPEGVTRGQPVSAAEAESQVAGVRRMIGRIARYEARFRADGLLPEGSYIRTTEAWDYGRASGMARWGLGARFCTLEDAEQAVLRAGRAAQSAYRSWEDFSAGYILGRCLHFDEEEFGSWYQEMVDAHRLLTTDPASPWLNIPWK
ncbi:DUF1266 domain-containing protein [Streptomyces klenkii]|uniref:DUF1266 domain-containing protein n=1 Tax=Streptomyces klenkii TaxID=1420899 RepID=A0A3B0BCU8_9ACTN|nr:DUF1266 domain-containing protein [Streptomyces klenkii]RKN70492.1 DUF1266 domain-containing protein [Streptomyces klenkii]